MRSAWCFLEVGYYSTTLYPVPEVLKLPSTSLGTSSINLKTLKLLIEKYTRHPTCCSEVHYELYLILAVTRETLIIQLHLTRLFEHLLELNRGDGDAVGEAVGEAVVCPEVAGEWLESEGRRVEGRWWRAAMR